MLEKQNKNFRLTSNIEARKNNEISSSARQSGAGVSK